MILKEVGPNVRVSRALVHLLNLSSAIRDLSPLAELSVAEELLLDDLIIRWHDNVTLTVSDVMNDTRYPSPITAYRRLIALRDKGIVDLDVAFDDRRIKHVRPTKAALLYIEMLEEAVDQMISDALTA